MSLARETVRAACVIGWVLLAVGDAHAQAAPRAQLAGRADVAVLGGYDSNPQLAINPNARRLSNGTAAEGPGSSGVGAAVLDAYGMWVGGAWVGLGGTSDLRGYYPTDADTGDARHDTALHLFGGLPAGDHELSLLLQAGRYDASFGLDNAWYGALAPAVRLALSRQWSLGAEPRLGFRDYSQGAQTNLDLGGRVDLQLRGSTWVAMIGGELDRRYSTDDFARRVQLVPLALLMWRVPDWELSMRVAMFARWFDAGSQDGVEHTADLHLRARLSSGLWLTSQLGFGVARGEANALIYERATVMLGLAATWQRDVADASNNLDRSSQGPAHVSDAGTRFEVCHPGARSVAVIGTFNDWSAARGRLARGANGCFTGELAVPPGRHRYQWLIDGEVVRPEAAPAYASDGFGGEDAVLVLPE